MDWIPKFSFAVITLVTWLAWFLLAYENYDAIPNVGLRKEPFALIRTTLRIMQEAEGLKNRLHAGYHKVSRNIITTRQPNARISARGFAWDGHHPTPKRRPLGCVTFCRLARSHFRQRESSTQLDTTGTG